MKTLVQNFVRYKIWADVLMISIVAFGLLSLSKTRSSFFPETPTDRISIGIIYPGASPEEMEKGVVELIEEKVDALEGVYQYSANAYENGANLDIRIDKGFDTQEVLQELKNEIDRIPNFPRGMERPQVQIVKAHSTSARLAVAGDAPLWTLKQYVERLRLALMEQKGISQTTVEGYPEREIIIEVKAEALERFNLRYSEIVQAVQANNIDQTVGGMETPKEELFIRIRSRKEKASEIENYPVRALSDGSFLTLKDVAIVKEKESDSPRRSYFNGKPALFVSVNKTNSEDALQQLEEVKEVMQNFKEQNPHASVELVYDSTISLRGRINLLVKNGIVGFLLVLIVLAIFLNLRLAFWVALGIPISMCGMFIAMWYFGLTINVISLFGMILVVGILVDDAIVVGENIFQHFENGATPVQAAVRGATDMIKPVGMAVLTTIVAFLPFFFLDGGIGKFIWHIAFVVIWCLVVSLVESLLILPAHLAHSKGLQEMRAKPHPLRRKINTGFDILVNKYYGRSLRKIMKYPLATIVTGFGCLFLCVVLLKSGKVGFSFFPHIDRDNVSIDLSLTAGTQEDITDSWLQKIEVAAQEVNEEFSKDREDGLKVIRFITRQIGFNSLGASGPHAGSIRLDLLDGEIRNLRSFEITNAIAAKVGSIPGAEKVSFGGGGRWGKPISVNLLGSNKSTLIAAQKEVKEVLEQHVDLKNVIDNADPGRKEIQLQITDKGRSLGFTVASLSKELRQAFFGQEVQRFQRGVDEIRIWVKLAKSSRENLGQLESYRVLSPNGEWVFLRDVVTMSIQRGPARIQHMDGKLRVSIEAELINPDKPTEPIKGEIEEMLPKILKKYSGVSVAYNGQARSRAMFTGSLKPAFMMGLLVILILLILVFRSYTQMLIIFLMIPMGLVGAIMAHMLNGNPMSFLSILGLCALMGVIINDSIVYIDSINRNLQAKMTLHEAVYKAGLSRFRPIVLTTLSTAVGMLPLIFEKSLQAKFLIPMALALAGGLVLGSVFILFMVPALFILLNRMKFLWMKLWGYRGTEEGVESAVIEMEEWK